AGRTGCRRHALPARAPRRGDHRGRARGTALDRVSAGREPPPPAEGHPGDAHGGIAVAVSVRRRVGGPRGVAARVLAMPACGRARRAPPSGGPPDVTPPKVVASVPDSGAARVGRTDPLVITFSEPMEPRSTSDAVSIVPYVPIKQRRWSGRTLTVVPAESLR